MDAIGASAKKVYQIQSTFYKKESLDVLKIGVAMGMEAAGVPITKVAKVLDRADARVERSITRIPGAREMVAEYRDKLKALKIQKAHAVEGRVWSRLENEVAQGEAKDVDAISRSLLALEKIQVSVSGEAQRVDVNNLNATPAIDLKILINQLLGDDALPKS